MIAAAAFGAVIMFAALAPTLPVELLALALVGWASISFMSTGNSTLQLGAAPAMRGRVMALWFVAFQGSTPIGGPDRRLGHGLGRRPRRPGSGRASHVYWSHLWACSRCATLPHSRAATPPRARPSPEAGRRGMSSKKVCPTRARGGP